MSALSFANEYNLQHQYDALIHNAELVSAIHFLAKEHNTHNLISLMKNPAISAEQIITYCMDKNKRPVVDYLFDDFLLNENKKIHTISDTLNDNELSDILLQFQKLAIETYYLSELISSPDKCHTVKVLLDAKIVSKDEIIKTVSSNLTTEAILLLDKRGLNSCIPLVFDSDSMKLLDLLSPLKSKYANQVTESMLLNKEMYTALMKNSNHEDKLLILVTLFNQGSFTPDRFALFTDNGALCKHAVAVIEAGYPSCINEKTLPDNLKSPEEFMLNVVSENYRALRSSADSQYFKHNSAFMLAAAKKDVRVLEIAADH
ncbi:hypothetical protein, partial [uncultured Legionella sp.]|uniref:hypothetical protein n=1 Tax=uncultured Legionella sp. TaxID=210934 RepID=UPI00260515FB